MAHPRLADVLARRPIVGIPARPRDENPTATEVGHSHCMDMGLGVML